MAPRNWGAGIAGGVAAAAEGCGVIIFLANAVASAKWFAAKLPKGLQRLITDLGITVGLYRDTATQHQGSPTANAKEAEQFGLPNCKALPRLLFSCAILIQPLAPSLSNYSG